MRNMRLRPASLRDEKDARPQPVQTNANWRAAEVRYRGLMQEKFLERLLAENIQITSAKRIDDRVMLLYVPEKDLGRLLALGERLSLDLKLLRHSASSGAARTLRKRMSLLPALMLFIAVLIFFSSRIWLIELTIDDTVSGETVASDGGAALRDGLAELGIAPGVSRAAFDANELELALMDAVPDYAFIGVRLTGVRLLVEAVRELPAPELYDISGARDLVSDSDAVIVQVNALAGKAAIKPGDTVRRGQVLIRGEEKLTDEVTHGVCALGEVVARCWVTGEAEDFIYETKRAYTGRESFASELRLMDFFYPLKGGETYANEEVDVRRLPVGGLFLPLNIVSTHRREFEESHVPADLDEVREKITQISFEIAEAKLPQGCVIVDKWIDYSMIEGDKIRARAVIEIHRNIAVARQALNAGGM